ncbi:GNAT family N-acetyltransferase [Simkania negevensis]|uniref:GNAT family N-acetyltransferase n=1 Tax=Simkania negevensis TaxID=83561 RepID=A0ABS3AW52_9BACT|nr:GNAT family N-acetyltransferase [Simkania negevensis]
MQIAFKKMTESDVPLFLEWSEKPHVKETWFQEGYETRDYAAKKVAGNGYDSPFLILMSATPIGYIQHCDLFAYKTICPQPKGVFTDEPEGSFCVDLFIAEEDLLQNNFALPVYSPVGKKRKQGHTW